MRRYLIVAHRTLGGEHLLEEVVRRRDADGGRCSFHVLVPMEHPGAMWSEGRSHAATEAVLHEAVEHFAAHGIEVTGEVGDPNPVYAVESLFVRGDHYDEVLLSTLPPGPSRWLKVDVPHRMARSLKIPAPVTHLVAEPATV